MASKRMPVHRLPGYLGDIPLSSGSGCTVLTRCLQSVCLQLTVSFLNNPCSRVECCMCIEKEDSQHDARAIKDWGVS